MTPTPEGNDKRRINPNPRDNDMRESTAWTYKSKELHYLLTSVEGYQPLLLYKFDPNRNNKNRRAIPPNNNNAVPSHRCPQCTRSFQTRSALLTHERTMHGGNMPRQPTVNVRLPPRRLRRRVPMRINNFAKAGGPSSFVPGRLGLTEQSEQWALRALSPCDERIGGAARIPDSSGTASAVLFNKIIHVLQAPGGPSGPWNLLIYSPPFADVAFLYKAWKAAVDPSTVDWAVVPYRDLDIGTATIPLTSNWDTQEVSGAAQSTLQLQTDEYRQTAKGITATLNGSSITDQGMVLAAQWGDKYEFPTNYKVGYPMPGPSPTPLPGNIKQVILLRDVPITTDDLFAKDPQAYRAQARAGAYLPLKFNGPVSDYVPVTTTAEGTGDTQMGLPVFIHDSATTADLPVPLTTTTTGAVVLLANGVTNMQSGAMLFEGLSDQVSIDVKVQAGLELVPSSSSTWTGFSEPPPADVDTAQRQVHLVQRHLASAHPASANWLGTLLKTVAMVLGPYAIKLLSGMATRGLNQLSSNNPRNKNPGGYMEESVD